MLLYNLILAGFDCNNARVGQYDYNVSVILKKHTIDVLHMLAYDAGDIEILRPYFPHQIQYRKTAIDTIFDGNITNLDWVPQPNYIVQKVQIVVQPENELIIN